MWSESFCLESRKGRFVVISPRCLLDGLMFQQKYRGQITLKKIRTEPFTFQGGIYVSWHTSYRWISSCLNEETVDQSSFGCYCFGERQQNDASSRWLNGSLRESAFPLLILSWGGLETEEYPRLVMFINLHGLLLGLFLYIDPFEYRLVR